MDLLPGVDPHSVRDGLRDLRNRLGSAATGVPTVASLLAAQNNYLSEVEMAETMMQRWFAGDTWLDHLHSARYWHIRELRAGSPRPWPLLAKEVEWQQAWLDRLTDQLDALIKEDSQADPVAARAVLDTNAHLHFKPFTDIDWCGVLGQEKVRIIVPLAVLRELDDKKNMARRPTGDRAGARLKAMRQRLAGRGAGPAQIRDNVTLEVLLDRRGHQPHLNTDEEILDRTEALTSRKGGPVRLVTGDLSMQLRAEARGLTVVELPDEERLLAPPADH